MKSRNRSGLDEKMFSEKNAKKLCVENPSRLSRRISQTFSPISLLPRPFISCVHTNSCVISQGGLAYFKIDPCFFSLIFQMRDYWQKSYNIDVNSPVIGVIEPKLVSTEF